MSYSFWNSFISNWAKGGKGIGGWTDPDEIPLINAPGSGTLSSNYIPEPWWGNDGSDPLHSVVINFNPGMGGPNQRLGVVPFKTDYAHDIVNSSVLSKTANWHWTRRGNPVLSSLNRIGAISALDVKLASHLSIELIPWHTQTVTKSYKQYVLQNGAAIFNHVLTFAAKESTRIIGSGNIGMQNKVLLKMSKSSVLLLLKSLSMAGYSFNLSAVNNCPLGDGHWLPFTITQLPDVKFIAVWGSKSRNNFPSANQMDYILQRI